jgi:hypothetical protein
MRYMSGLVDCSFKCDHYRSRIGKNNLQHLKIEFFSCNMQKQHEPRKLKNQTCRLEDHMAPGSLEERRHLNLPYLERPSSDV